MLSSGPGPLLYLVTPRPRPHIELYRVEWVLWLRWPGHSGHGESRPMSQIPQKRARVSGELVPFEALDQQKPESWRVMQPWWWNNSPEQNSPEVLNMINYLLSSNRIVTEAIKLISFPKKDKLMLGMMLFLAKLMTNAVKNICNQRQCLSDGLS